MGNTSAGQSYFMQKFPNEKYLQKLGKFELRIIRKKRKISVTFSEKV
jgi:hypothetical protein